MNDFLRIITHARRFKAAVKKLEIDHLEESKNKLEKIIEDRRKAEEAELQEQKERLDKIKQYQEMLAADGIHPDELQEMQDKIAKRRQRKPKYEVWDDNGQHITWTGQGRMPNALKAKVEAGEPIETFLIDA